MHIYLILTVYIFVYPMVHPSEEEWDDIISAEKQNIKSVGQLLHWEFLTLIAFK